MNRFRERNESLHRYFFRTLVRASLGEPWALDTPSEPRSDHDYAAPDLREPWRDLALPERVLDPLPNASHVPVPTVVIQTLRRHRHSQGEVRVGGCRYEPLRGEKAL